MVRFLMMGYSVLKESTGFATAALSACTLMVISVMNKAPEQAMAKTVQEISIR